MTLLIDQPRVWAVRAGAFFVAGVIGGGLLVLGTEQIGVTTRSPLQVILVLSVATTCSALLLWRLMIRNGRWGPAWGGLVGASAPLLGTIVLFVVLVIGGTDSPASALYGVALIQLFQLPITGTAALAGGLLALRGRHN